VGKPNPQNLKPAKKGEVRNPKGRPPTRDIEKRIKEFMFDTVRQKDGSTKERMELIMNKLFHDAMVKSDRASIKILLEYGFSKPVQKTEVTTPDGEPLKVHAEIFERVLERYKNGGK
jgi:hypothetical protein